MCRFRDEVPFFVGEEQEEEFDAQQSEMYKQIRISPEGQFIASLLVSSTLELILKSAIYMMPLIEYYTLALFLFL